MHASLDRLHVQMNSAYLELGFNIYADRQSEVELSCSAIIKISDSIYTLQSEIMDLEYEESEDRSP